MFEPRGNEGQVQALAAAACCLLRVPSESHNACLGSRDSHELSCSESTTQLVSVAIFRAWHDVACQQPTNFAQLEAEISIDYLLSCLSRCVAGSWNVS